MVAVIVTLPVFLIVTSQVEFTLAMLASLLDQLIFFTEAFDGVIVAVNWYVFHTVQVNELVFKVIQVTCVQFIEKLHVALWTQSSDVQVIVQFQLLTGVTSQVSLTVAILVLLLVRVTHWYVALFGDIVTVNCLVVQYSICTELSFNTNEVILTTHTSHWLSYVIHLSFVLTVIVHCHSAIAVTNQLLSTVAIDGSLLIQVISWFIALDGVMVATNWYVCVSSTEIELVFKLISLGRISHLKLHINQAISYCIIK